MSDACTSVVVIMAKQPAPGRTKTRLCPPLTPAAAAELSEALLHDTVSLVSSVRGIELAVAVTPPSAIDELRPALPAAAHLVPVEGADIGDCLAQATGRLFAGGFRRVMALNADGPTLPGAYIERAHALLDQHAVVLGPSEDGGYYLAGLRRPCPDLFRGIAWSTAQVTRQTVDRAAALGLSTALLPPWYDIDTAADLERLREELACLPDAALGWTRRFFAGRKTENAHDTTRESPPGGGETDSSHEETRG
jgi:rSAM/selenodomain-associated transferase 1